MPVVRRLIAVCALALAPPAPDTAGAAAPATLVEIYTDYADNGEITGDYAFDDLVAALARGPRRRRYTDFADAVEDKLDADYLGRSPGEGRPT